MKSVTFQEYLDILKENKKNNLNSYSVLFITSKECTVCNLFKDMLDTEFDSYIFSPNVYFYVLDIDNEIDNFYAFLPPAVPSLIIHHKNDKILETAQLPMDKRGNFSSSLLEFNIQNAIDLREKFFKEVYDD
jgi:hypothetical protein